MKQLLPLLLTLGALLLTPTVASANADPSELHFVQSVAEPTATNSITGLYFKPDGLKVFFTESDPVVPTKNGVYSTTLGAAWNINTMSATTQFKDMEPDGIVNPRGLFLRADGLKLFLTDQNTDLVYEYTMSVAWDITTATLTHTKTIAAEASISLGLFFRDNGLQLYITDAVTDRITEWSLTTAWDVSTASYLRATPITDQSRAISISENGVFVTTLDGSLGLLTRLTLSVPWDISSAGGRIDADVFTHSSTTVIAMYLRHETPTLFTVDNNLNTISEWAYYLSSDVRHYVADAIHVTDADGVVAATSFTYPVAPFTYDIVARRTVVQWDVGITTAGPGLGGANDAYTIALTIKQGTVTQVTCNFMFSRDNTLAGRIPYAAINKCDGAPLMEGTAYTFETSVTMATGTNRITEIVYSLTFAQTDTIIPPEDHSAILENVTQHRNGTLEVNNLSFNGMGFDGFLFFLLWIVAWFFAAMNRYYWLVAIATIGLVAAILATDFGVTFPWAEWAIFYLIVLLLHFYSEHRHKELGSKDLGAFEQA